MTVRLWLSIAVACSVVFFAYWFFPRRGAVASDLIVVCDTRLSSVVCEQIAEEVRAACNAPRKAVALLEILREKHPYIVGVTVALRGTERVVSLMVDTPVLMLAPDTLITNQGYRTLSTTYRRSVQDFLFNCIVHDWSMLESTNMVHLARWALGLPAWVREQYACTWYNPTRIVLKRLHEPWILVVTEDTVFDAHLQHAVDKVYAYSVERKKKEKRSKGTGWSVDARFAHRLILSRLKGEGV